MNKKNQLFQIYDVILNTLLGFRDYIFSLRQIKKISNTNKCIVRYIDESSIEREYSGLINNDRSLLLILGLNKLCIINKLYYSENDLLPIAYVSAKNHVSLHLEDFKEPDYVKTPDSLSFESYSTIAPFLQMTLKDIKTTVNMNKADSRDYPQRDFGKDAKMVVDNEFMKIGIDTPNERLIAVGIISLLGGLLAGGVIALMIAVILVVVT